MRVLPIATLGLVVAVLAMPGLAAAQNQTRLRGTIEKVDGSTLSVRSRDGETVAVRLAEGYTVVDAYGATLADIRPGMFVGTAAVPQADGVLRAQEVHIFAEAMRGTGEGHRPMDLMPRATMTNATIASAVSGVNGSTLELTYKGGRQTVLVPPDVPIVRYEPGKPGDLAAGAAVSLPVRRAPDGTWQASRITVGRGVVPPI